MPQVDRETTEQTRSRYNRIAAFYDLLETPPELVYRRWRRRVWTQVQGPRVIEVGVGTGKNIPFYPPNIEVTGIDISNRMLEKAHQRARKLKRSVELMEMDAQQLEFEDATFDTGVATFVFCSVPDPVLGLKELARVVKPGGQLVLLEHMRADSAPLAKIMDILDPLVVRIMGPHINRRTVENIKDAGLRIDHLDELDPWGIFRLMVAVPT